jgi:hypothetical protein
MLCKGAKELFAGSGFVLPPHHDGEMLAAAIALAVESIGTPESAE